MAFRRRCGRLFRRCLGAAVLLVSPAAPVAPAAAAPDSPASMPAAAATAPTYHFRTLKGSGAMALSTDVLTAEERRFIAALPELRVAVPLTPAQPYELIAADGQVSGIHPDLLLALARFFGLRLTPVVVPDWTSALQAAREKRVDIVMTVGVTTARMEYLAFTLGATPLPGALWARAGDTVNPDTARFAIERDYQANDWVRRQFPNAQIITVASTPDALRAVASGAADVYLGSLLQTSDWLAREPVPGVEINRMLNYGTGYYHFGVRKDWAPLAAILNKGIQGLRTHTPDALAAALRQLPQGVSLPNVLQAQGAEAALLAARPVWRVGGVRGLQLLNDIDERGVHSGIAAETTEQVARRLGVAVQVVPFDSVAAMLDGLRQKHIDLVPFLTRTPAREQDFLFSAPYVEMPYVIVARSDGPHYWNLDSLRGKTLALQQQHPLRELLAARYPDIRIQDATSSNGAMDLVIQRKADAAVEVKLFANLRINGPDGERLRIVSEVQELPAQFHFAALKGEGPMVQLVDRALADIEPAERQRMLRRWVAVDLSPAFPWRRHAPALAVGGASLLLLLGGTWWWVLRLRHEVAARRRTEELLSDIAANVPGLAFRYVLNASGELQRSFYTPGARALLGRELDEHSTVLTALSPHLEPEDRDRALAEQALCQTSGQRFKVTCRYHHPDGRLRWLLAEAVQTVSSHGLPVWTGYLVDVSAERELQQRLAREAESRSLMLASASHELRAPTHTLSLALQSLSTVGLDDEQRKAVNLAQDSAHTLAELLSDVLDAARSRPDAMQLRPRSFDLHQLLEDLAGAWRAAARTKGLAFELHIAADVPRTVQTDPLRLKQVLINLLSNACKYTQQGKVTLQASCIPAASATEATPDAQPATGTRDALTAHRSSILQLVVTDSGIGIATADQARLFAPFVTLDDPRADTGAQGSSGLGLANSHRLATLLGGQLELHSSPGRGTRVVLTLPLPDVQRAAVGSGTVLVCDDDETSRLLMGLMLRRHGFETQDAAGAEQAMELWRQGHVRALVTDLDLPGMSGLELIRKLRAEEHQLGTRTPVIICSGSPVPAADQDSQRDLYDAYLVKPVNVATLADTLHKLGVVP